MKTHPMSHQSQFLTRIIAQEEAKGTAADTSTGTSPPVTPPYDPLNKMTPEIMARTLFFIGGTTLLVIVAIFIVQLVQLSKMPS